MKEKSLQKSPSKTDAGAGEKGVEYNVPPGHKSKHGEISKKQKTGSGPAEEPVEVSGLNDPTSISGDNIIVDPPLSDTTITSEDITEGQQSTLAVQISFKTPSAKDRIGTLKIKRTTIVGRPPRLFGSSMGDHTTAFSVHRRGIENAIKGKSLKQAAQYIVGDNGLLAKSLDLPGAQKTILKASGQKDNIKRHQKEMQSLGEELQNAIANNALSAPLLLQRLIGTYLEYRELIPLSALNIAAKSQGLAGKGKGEAKYVEMLVAHESGKKNYQPTVLEKAIFATLDFSGLAATAIETNKELRFKMAPGVTEKLTRDKVFDLVLDQHLQTIEACFPKAFKAAKIKRSQKGRAKILGQFRYFIYKRTVVERDHWEKQKKATELKAHNQKAKLDLAGRQFFKSEKKGGLPRPMYEEARIEADAAEAEYKTALKAYEGYATLVEDMEEDGIPEEPETEIPVSKRSRKESPTGHAVELNLGSDDKISGLRFAGRTPSPFSGTMGAHTTAWVVHLDAMTATLRGKTLAEAIATLDARMVELKAKADEMSKLQKKDTSPENLEEAKTNAEAFKGMSANTLDAGSRLQEYIGAVLTYINFIPGSTINKIDTGGKAEGRYRNILLDYQRSGPDANAMASDDEDLKGITATQASAVQGALHSLLDIARVSPKIRGKIVEYHNKELKVAYPKACALDEKLKQIAAKQSEKKRKFSELLDETTTD